MFKRIKLGKKLLVAFLAVGLIPFAAVSLVSLQKSDQALSAEAFAKLTAVRDIKKKQVQDYYRKLANQIVVFSDSIFAKDALADFQGNVSEYAAGRNVSDEQLAQMKNQLLAYYDGEYAQAYRKNNEGKSPDTRRMLQGIDPNGIALQYDYIRGNENPIGAKQMLTHALEDPTAYAQTHQAYHPAFRKELEVSGFRDILLVETDTGRVVYSTVKQVSLGTSLIDGPHAQSGLGKAFQKANAAPNADDVIIEDFSPFGPSYGQPTGFIASPIIEMDVRQGVAIFALSLDELNAIMSERTGMGATGETYLVGADGLMRSDAHLDPEHRSVIKSFQNPTAGRVDTEATRLAFSGETGQRLIQNYSGDKVLSTFSPLAFNGLEWAIVAEMDEKEAFQAVHSLKWIMTLFGLAGVAAVLTIALLVTRAIVKPVARVVDGLTELSTGEGDLTMRLDVASDDEIGILSRRFNDFMQNLQAMIKEISGGIDTLSTSSTSLADIAGHMTGTAEKTAGQSEAVESAAKQMTQNMDSVSAAMEQSATNANMVAASAEEMTATINDIAKNAEQASAISGKTVAQAGVASEKMKALGVAAQAINKVTETITEISEQTNLLALNATIEAARAGDAGKGFAVVANEIKELARQTAEATLDIKAKVEGVQATTASSVKEIDSISRFIDEANETIALITTAVGEQTTATEEIAGNISQVSQGFSDVNTNVAESATVTADITHKIGDVNHAAGEIANSSGQLNLSADELSQLSDKLRELVGRFKI